MDRCKVPNHGEVGMVKCLKLVIVSVYWCTFFLYLQRKSRWPSDFGRIYVLKPIITRACQVFGGTAQPVYDHIWLVVWNSFIFHIGNNNPNDSVRLIFFRGVWNLQPDIFRKGQNVGVSMTNVVTVTLWLSNERRLLFAYMESSIRAYPVCQKHHI